AAKHKRQTCPNCQSPFMPGKSAAEEEAATKPQPAAGYNKTMLGETAPPPIRFRCSRCKKLLEAPASEAGAKIPCPECSHKLTIPAASTHDSTPPAAEEQAPTAQARTSIRQRTPDASAPSK